MLDLIEDADAPGEAQGVHVVQAEVQQVLGSSGDTVPLAGDMRDQTCRQCLTIMQLLLYYNSSVHRQF